MADADRRVEVRYTHKTEEGRFIEWGRTVTHDEGNNPIPVSCGIVELDTGKVIEVEPNQIRFLDR